MPRTEMEVQRDLDTWEMQLDLHLGHCAVCDERVERYCSQGTEISVMVTRLMMEKLRLQVARRSEIEPVSPRDTADSADPADRESDDSGVQGGL